MQISSVGSQSLDLTRLMSGRGGGGPRPSGPPPAGGKPDAKSMAGNLASAVTEKADSDGDGSLSISELGSSETLFNTLDTNKDGLVSSAELAAGIETDMKAFEAGNQGTTSVDGSGTTSTSAQSGGIDGLRNLVMSIIDAQDSTQSDTTKSSDSASTRIRDLVAKILDTQSAFQTKQDSSLLNIAI